MISGRDYFISQTEAVIDQISQFYDDENDVSMLNMTIISNMIEQIGGFIIGNLLKDSPSQEDYALIQKCLDTITSHFEDFVDNDQYKKLSQIITVKIMRAEGRDLDRQTFCQLMGSVWESEAPKWYDEVVTGFIASQK